MSLQNKIALVTGGGRGIGRAIAIALAREGADVIVAARTSEQVSDVAREIQASFGVHAFGTTCDVSDSASVSRMFEVAGNEFGRGPDILVNNAGMAESAPLVRTTDELWQTLIAVNLTGAFFCIRAALPSMLDRGWGRVINIASIAGKIGAPYVSAYSASKHGVIGLTRSAALEVAAKGVTVNAICPGYVDTDMTRYAIQNITSKTSLSADDAEETLLRMSPQHRLITAEEVAGIAVLLASEEGRGINGQAINIDGGAVFY